MNPKYLCFIGVFALGACSSSVHTVTVLPDEFEISASAPAGMYGGFIGLSPSQDLLQKRAAELCPHGFKKVGEDQDKGMLATPFIRWDILCEVSSPS